MIYALIGLFLLLVLMLIAIRIGINKESTEKEGPKPLIHASGIYSVVRKSPREEVLAGRPSEEEMRKYLSEKNEDILGNPVSDEQKERLIAHFYQSLERNVSEIEAGDRQGIEFYYYTFEREDPVCANYVSKGHYVTRENIFHNWRIVPPFHIGCACQIKGHQRSERLRETTEIRMRPLIRDKSTVAQLPNWHSIAQIA